MTLTDRKMPAKIAKGDEQGKARASKAQARYRTISIVWTVYFLSTNIVSGLGWTHVEGA